MSARPFESLETRTMFSVALVGTEIQVTSAPGINDTVRIFQRDAGTIRVEENGQVFEFVDTSVNSIRVNSGDGNDRVEMANPNNVALTENVTLIGGAGNDSLTGGNGNDSLDGGAGDDSMVGGAGNDRMHSGTGNNQMFGGEGNDSMRGGLGRDVMDGGLGTDLADYADRSGNVGITLDDAANDGETFFFFDPVANRSVPRTEGDDVRSSVENVTTGSGNDSIIAQSTSVANVFRGGAGNDKLRGREGADVLEGQGGNDQLLGGGANDQLLGGTENDTLIGGASNDDLRGGDGDDILVGGIGLDQYRGENGNDTIFAADNQIDTFIDGGAGTDLLDKDAADPVLNVEDVI